MGAQTRVGRWSLAAVVALACAAQLAVLASKDVLILEWRPTDLAAIALNYYRSGFHFLYPQVLWGGAGPGYVEMEFPLVPYSIAVLYALFGVHGWLALAWPALSGIGLVAVVYAFARRVFGPLAGLVAGVFAATAPTWVDMSTGLWPDAPPVFFGALGLYWLSAWTDDDAPWGLVLSACCVSLAILLKMTSLYLGLPVLFLLWQKYQGGWWRTWQAWLFALVALVPSVVWYAHAYGLFLRYGNTFGILGGGYLKFATAALLTSPRFYLRTFLRLLLFHVTPLGGLFVAVGLASRIDRPNQMLLPVWFGTIVLYLLVAAQGVDMGHAQYALPLVPPCAMLAGLGFVAIYRRLD